MRDALASALRLAAAGVPSFPCLATKGPACATGFKAATADPAALCALWRRHGGDLVGVPTGAASGFDVLDVDSTKHVEAAEWLRTNRDRLPATREHATRSGGRHLLFSHTPGLRCSAGKVCLGIDVRAVGGFVIWWPSAGFPVAARGPVAPWPQWLLGLLQPPPEAVRTAWPPVIGTTGRAYAGAALRRAVERVTGAPEGQRNATLNGAAFGLRRLIAEGALSPREVATALAHAALTVGLDARETERTIGSALRAGGVG